MNATKLFSIQLKIGLIPLLFLYSCNKEEDAPIITSPLYPGHTVLYPDTLITAESYNSPEFYAFDVDNDKVNDYELMCNQEHVVCVYTYFEAQISCLNKDAFLVTDSIIDTTFVNVKTDTTFSDGKTEIVAKKQFSPKRLDKKDSIAKITSLHYVVPFKENNLVDYTNYSTGKYTLTKQDYSIYYAQYEYGPGWSYRMDIYFLSPKIFPHNQSVYIGIKKIVKGQIKTGWIKLMLINYRRICVLEVALQK